jgi:hypothetical protein
VERIDAGDDSYAEFAFATGDEDSFIPPDLRRRAELCALHRFWLDKKRRAGGRLPRRSEIRPEDLKPWLGWVNLLEVVDGGRDFVFRLYGSNVAREFGRDLTGRGVGDLPPEHVPIVTAPFARVIRERVPCASRHHILFEDGRSFVWERLILPLAEDGATVDILLIALYRVLLTEKGGAKPASPLA